MYHDVHGSPLAGTRSLARGWAQIRSIRSIERFVARLVQSHEDRRRRRSAIRDLQRFDDRVLRDLGIERDRIPDVADAQVVAYRR